MECPYDRLTPLYTVLDRGITIHYTVYTPLIQYPYACQFTNPLQNFFYLSILFPRTRFVHIYTALSGLLELDGLCYL